MKIRARERERECVYINPGALFFSFVAIVDAYVGLLVSIVFLRNSYTSNIS